MTSEENNVVAKPVDQTKIKQIIRVAVILSVVTAIEFLVAFTMNAGTVRTSFFVIMTLIKAFYIVAEFMHLGHEVKSLIWTIVTPFIFVVWLIVALLMEGSSIYNVLF